MFYRCDDVPVWQAWCQYHQELKAMQQAARAFAESLDAEPVYGAWCLCLWSDLGGDCPPPF